MTRNVVFVVGAQRSGTTVSAVLLASHPDIYLTVNGKLLYYLITWIYRDPNGVADKHLRLDEVAHGLKRRPVLGVEAQDVDRMISMLEREFDAARSVDRSPADMVRSIWLEVYTALAGPAGTVGDKYNEYLLQLPELAALFPEARYVFFHRNPFDAAESMLRAFAGRPWAPRTLVEAVAKWTEWNARWLAASKAMSPTAFLDVPYEEMVQDPSHTFRRICSFLELPCEAHFLRSVTGAIRTTKPGAHRTTPGAEWDSVREAVPGFRRVSSALGYGDAT